MMLKTGEFVQAGKLKIGQSLFQVSTCKHNDGYVRVGLHDGKKGKAYGFCRVKLTCLKNGVITVKKSR